MALKVESLSFSMTKDEFFYSFKEQTANEKAYAFLESGRGGHYSIAAINPFATAKSAEGGLHISWQNGEMEFRKGEALAQLESFINEYNVTKDVNLPIFQGGAIGFISYDYVRTIEVLPTVAEDDLQVPDLFFYLFDHWAVHNVKDDTVTLMKLAISDVDLESWASDWQHNAQEGLKKRLFEQEKAVEVKPDESELIVSFSGQAFEDAVRKIQQYIGQGDVFQVNLSVRQAKQLQTTPVAMYEAVRSFNPSPYMALIGSEEFAVVSGSPELLD